MSFSPERRKSRSPRPCICRSHKGSTEQVSRSPFSVVTPPMIWRSAANALTACSALLLFQGTPSKLRNVKSLSRFFSNRLLTSPLFRLGGSVRKSADKSFHSRQVLPQEAALQAVRSMLSTIGLSKSANPEPTVSIPRRTGASRHRRSSHVSGG